MKHRKFNKFGGTECRTKDQISTYVLFINWILKYQKENLFENKDDVEKAFRKFCDDENIYKYKKTDSIKRFKMICSNLDKDLHIFHFDNIKKIYKLDDKFDLRNPSRSFLFFMQNAWPESNYPFKQMLKFMHENPNCNDANKLSHAFMVYDGKEPFKDLYEMNVIDQIVDNECKDIKLTGKLESFITFNKPIKYFSLIKEIYKKIYNGLEILESDLKDFKKRDKYLYGIIYDNQRKIRFSNARNFAKNLNEIDPITFLKRLKKAQLKSNIDQEYCDLFNRWMHGIGLANSTSTKETKYLSCRIYLENGNYFINIPNNQPCFPYTLKQCIENLKKIQDEKYIDIKSTLSLNDTPNSAIAEYFVNLFFCYKFGIEPSKFKEYVYTQTDNELKPVFTAPGSFPDMRYIKNNHVYCIETTIIKNSEQIRKAEIVPCIRHLYNTISNEKLDFNNNHLHFINYNKDKKFSDNILKAFRTEWSIRLSDNNKKNCELNFKNCSFEDLKI